MTDENPYERAQATAERHNFQCPIDEVDAMARVLDPVRSLPKVLVCLCVS